LTDPCKFAKKTDDPFKVRVCELDKVSCANWNDPKLVSSCPTLTRYNEGEVIGGTPASLPKELPRCFRSGKYGTFDGGMPPQYLRGQIHKKKE